MFSNIEREFSRLFEWIYDRHDRNIEKGDNWMENKSAEIDQLHQQAIEFESKMERHAQQIERWIKEKEPKQSKLFIFDSDN